MRFLIVLSLAIFSMAPTVASSEHQQSLQKNDFTTWPRAHVREFGCFLEMEFRHKDNKFNCSLKQYKNKGDPCKNTVEYYEGPKFPKEFAGKVNPMIESINLAWEHGDLQRISVTLNRKYSEKELRSSLKLPTNASIQDCSKTSTCIVLDGFDHMGAGDVDCSG